jgi:hypothetical protein
VACVTQAGLFAIPDRIDPSLHLVRITGDPVKLEADPPVALSLIQYLRLVEHQQARRAERRVVQTVGYIFAVLEGDRHTELFSYHWDADGAVPIPHPHLPVAANAKRRRIGKFHFPTGPIMLQQVLWVLIRDFKVTPRRPDWERVSLVT